MTSQAYRIGYDRIDWSDDGRDRERETVQVPIPEEIQDALEEWVLALVRRESAELEILRDLAGG